MCVILPIHLVVSLLRVSQVQLELAVFIGAKKANDLDTSDCVEEEHDSNGRIKPYDLARIV